MVEQKTSPGGGTKRKKENNLSLVGGTKMDENNLPLVAENNLSLVEEHKSVPTKLGSTRGSVSCR